MINNIEPISPNDISKLIIGPALETLISRINEAITLRNWHESSVADENLRNNYFKILISLEVQNDKLKNALIHVYKKMGWDCDIAQCHSGHGPHYCFFVHKKHFVKED